MKRRTIIILEDNDDRIQAFADAVASLGSGFSLRLWRDANTMIEQCGAYIDDACLISLDHDLAPLAGSSADPGTGFEVAEFVAAHPSTCPVILHTSNHERRWSMHNEFRFAGWSVEIVPPLGDNWIHSSWLPRARAMIGV